MFLPALASAQSPLVVVVVVVERSILTIYEPVPAYVFAVHSFIHFSSIKRGGRRRGERTGTIPMFMLQQKSNSYIAENILRPRCILAIKKFYDIEKAKEEIPIVRA